jgi:hypothetical protein
MKSSQIATYEHYKSVYTTRMITKKDIVNICDQLTIEYQLNNLGEEYFEPEAITEGGIVFKSYTMNSGKYKTMRFSMNNKWPTVDKEWTVEDEDECVPKNFRIDLFLKAFDLAPKWTNEEKKIFLRVLCNNGFVSNKRGIKIAN